MFWVALYAVAEVLAVASAVHAVFTARTTQGTIAWVVGLIAFPWLGLPLYWMFGCRRFRAYSEAMKQARVEHAAAFREARRSMAAHQSPLAPDDGPEMTALTALSEEEFMRGDRLDLLIDGEATFEAILASVATAKRQICVLVYIMREDGLGTRLLEALAAKAAQGVEVCFLVDSLGSIGMNQTVMAKWRDRGLRLATFCSSSGWRDKWRLNFRNHRKIVVVDGEVGFVGGHNIGDEYLGLDPKFGRWRDTHVRVEGPTALQLQMVFAADWLFATGEKIRANWDALPQPAPEGQRSLVLASGPADDIERCTLFFLNVILMAKKRLWIASPYFVPDEGILAALQLAALRGVEVRILVPKRANELLVWLASLALLTELTDSNIHLHRYTGGFLHQKTLVVDDHFAAIGSANFDNRSFRLNFEVTLAVEGGEFPARVAAMLERDLADSIEVGREDYDDRPFHVKAGARVARLLSPIL